MLTTNFSNTYKRALKLVRLVFNSRNDGRNEPLHAECEALIWALGDGVHEDPAVLRCSICDGLFSIGEDGVLT